MDTAWDVRGCLGAATIAVAAGAAMRGAGDGAFEETRAGGWRSLRDGEGKGLVLGALGPARM
eukprot:751868-Pelagomonas_calceolata.AAC.4